MTFTGIMAPRGFIINWFDLNNLWVALIWSAGCIFVNGSRKKMSTLQAAMQVRIPKISLKDLA